MSTAENATQENPFLAVEQRLNFIAKQVEVNKLTPEFVLNVLEKNEQQENKLKRNNDLLEIFKLGQENFPQIARYLQTIFGRDGVKISRKINIKNEDQSIFTPISTQVKRGDSIKVKLPGDAFWTTVLAYSPITGEIEALVDNVLANTEEHGIDLGDSVTFNHSHIFEYEAMKEGEPMATTTAQEKPEEDCECTCE